MLTSDTTDVNKQEKQSWHFDKFVKKWIQPYCMPKQRVCSSFNHASAMNGYWENFDQNLLKNSV